MRCRPIPKACRPCLDVSSRHAIRLIGIVGLNGVQHSWVYFGAFVRRGAWNRVAWSRTNVLSYEVIAGLVTSDVRAAIFQTGYLTTVPSSALEARCCRMHVKCVDLEF